MSQFLAVREVLHVLFIFKVHGCGIVKLLIENLDIHASFAGFPSAAKYGNTNSNDHCEFVFEISVLFLNKPQLL